MTELITSQQNIRYLSGFSGSVGMLIMNGKTSYLIVDGRYGKQAASEVKKGIKVIQTTLATSLLDAAIDLLKSKKVREIGFEDDKMDVASFHSIKSRLPGIRFRSISGVIRAKRMIKDKEEIGLLSKAALIADLAYDCVIRIVRRGMTEKDISAQLDYLIKTFKGDFPAFETLVSAGKHSAFPHGKPTDRKIEKGELLVMDFGARYKGYNSDITRMVSIGKPSQKNSRIFNAVLGAQLSAISRIKEGVSAGEIDKAARQVLEKEGLGKYFTHSTGHGIGLAVHEGPRISPSSRDIIRAGMVFTVEPGVYIPGVGGFRVEDMVVATRTGCHVLTKSPKRLEVA